MNIIPHDMLSLSLLSLEDMYPGLKLDADADIERVIVSLSAYTGAEGIDKEEILSRRSMGKQPSVKIVVPLWGAVAFHKEFTSPLTGQIDRVLSVVFRLEDDDEGEGRFASFSSVSVARFFEQSIRTIRPVGNWSKPLYAVFYRRKLDLGNTYLCKLVDAAHESTTSIVEED